MPEKILLIDGVKYEEWTDLRETEDLEPMIQEHAEHIFGEKALYIDRKQKLRSMAGTGSIPDAYVISLGGNSPHWHIVEIELSYKDPSRHLVTQLNDFVNGMKNSRNEIVSAINHWIKSDDIRALEFKRISQCGDIHEFLSELIKNNPILTIVIEKNTPKLKEAIQIFEERYKTEIVEFRTFRREGAEAVHAHLFEPVCEPSSGGTEGDGGGHGGEHVRGLKLYIRDGKNYNPVEALVTLGAIINKMGEGRSDLKATMPDGTILEYVGSTKNGKSKIAKVHTYLLDHGFIFQS